MMVAYKYYRYQYLASLFLFLIGEYSSKKCLLISIDNRNLNPRITEVKNRFILLSCGRNNVYPIFFVNDLGNIEISFVHLTFLFIICFGYAIIDFRATMQQFRR